MGLGTLNILNIFRDLLKRHPRTGGCEMCVVWVVGGWVGLGEGLGEIRAGPFQEPPSSPVKLSVLVVEFYLKRHSN